VQIPDEEYMLKDTFENQARRHIASVVADEARLANAIQKLYPGYGRTSALREAGQLVKRFGVGVQIGRAVS
jgi:hypothetical protein